MTEKAYTTGSTCPALAANALRLYSMRFCPYAERTRLVLAHLNIPHEVVNINLQKKPEWFFTKNPLGLVPVLEKDDKLVYESTVCDEYLEEVYGSHGLLPADPYQKARVKILMESVSKVTDKFYALLRARDKSEEEKQKGIEEFRTVVKMYENNLQASYFGGNKPSMLDFHLWPWFERIPTIQTLTGKTVLDNKEFPKILEWIKTMKDLPAVKTSIFSDDHHIEFTKSYLNQAPNYDIGLP